MQWFPQAPPNQLWDPAVRALSAVPQLKRAIDRVGPCTLWPSTGYFHRLVVSILSQQVSMKAAEAMHQRLRSQLPGRRVTPAAVLRLLETACDEQLRRCGLSRQKRSYLRDLAERFHTGQIDPRRLARLDDPAVIDTLTSVKGVGIWTAQMLLIFSMNRPDVWPAGDLGLRESLRRHFPRRFKQRPDPREAVLIADNWKPWRSIAAWYLWRSHEG